MGLIQQANLVNSQNPDSASVKKKTGLLGRIQSSSGYDVVLESFHEFLDAIHAERGGLLYPSEDGYSIFLFNKGFDLTTVKRLCPRTAQLETLFPSNDQWAVYAQGQLDRFESLFSSHERDSLAALYLRRVIYNTNTVCFLVLAESSLDINRIKIDTVQASARLPALLDIFTAGSAAIAALSLFVSINQSVSSMKAHAESAFASNRIATLVSLKFSSLFPDIQKLQTEMDLQTVYFAIIHRIAKQAGSANVIYIRENFDLHIVLFTSQPVDTDLYFYQLMKPLEKIFGAHRISRIQPQKVGISSSVTEVIGFLTGAV